MASSRSAAVSCCCGGQHSSEREAMTTDCFFSEDVAGENGERDAASRPPREALRCRGEDDPPSVRWRQWCKGV